MIFTTRVNSYIGTTIVVPDITITYTVNRDELNWTEVYITDRELVFLRVKRILM